MHVTLNEFARLFDTKAMEITGAKYNPETGLKCSSSQTYN